MGERKSAFDILNDLAAELGCDQQGLRRGVAVLLDLVGGDGNVILTELRAHETIPVTVVVEVRRGDVPLLHKQDPGVVQRVAGQFWESLFRQLQAQGQPEAAPPGDGGWAKE